MRPYLWALTLTGGLVGAACASGEKAARSPSSPGSRLAGTHVPETVAPPAKDPRGTAATEVGIKPGGHLASVNESGDGRDELEEPTRRSCSLARMEVDVLDSGAITLHYVAAPGEKRTLQSEVRQAARQSNAENGAGGPLQWLSGPSSSRAVLLVEDVDDGVIVTMLPLHADVMLGFLVHPDIEEEDLRLVAPADC